jgi:hypothetical protein
MVLISNININKSPIDNSLLSSRLKKFFEKKCLKGNRITGKLRYTGRQSRISWWYLFS